MDRLNQIALSRLNQVEQAVLRGIDYLYQHQYPNGEFCCYMAPDLLMQEWCVPDSTVFPTAVIANALLGLVDHSKVDAILKRTVPFFQYQMMHGGIWNYYTRWHPLFQLNPADIDDTSYVGALFDARQVVYPKASTQALMLANRSRQGGLYTWFVLRPRLTLSRTYWRVGLREMKRPIANVLFWLNHECSRNDMDGVVNANALYYLGVSEATQSVVSYLLRVVAEHQETRCDNWYHSPVNFYYALGRNYHKGVKPLQVVQQTVLERLMARQQPNGLFGGNLLETAHALCALIYWKGNPVDIERTLDVLLAHQAEHGEWSRATFFYSGRSKTVGWGSEELTTGFCLEALTAYRDWLKNQVTDR